MIALAAALLVLFTTEVVRSLVPCSRTQLPSLSRTSRRTIVLMSSEFEKNTKDTNPLSAFSASEILAPPTVDRRSLGALVLGQGVLFGATAALCSLFKVNPGMPALSMESLRTAVAVSVPMIGGGLLFDAIPQEPFQSIARDTRIYSLRLLGRGTTPALAAITALLISTSTGITEEFAFRGFLFPAINSALGLPAAYILSSAAFGLAHYPQFGFNAGVEALLGGVFAYSYVTSGYNIAVPIAVHALYDFATLFLSWLAATRSLKQRMRQAEEQLRGQQDLPLPDEIEFIARAVFGLLDANKDGAVDEREFSAGMKLFRVGVSTDPAEVRRLFESLDTNQDGRITYDEYAVMFRELVTRWVTMI